MAHSNFSQHCPESDHYCTQPVEDNGYAWCGCCGGMVRTYTHEGDTNQLRYYRSHRMADLPVAS